MMAKRPGFWTRLTEALFPSDKDEDLPQSSGDDDGSDDLPNGSEKPQSSDLNERGRRRRFSEAIFGAFPNPDAGTIDDDRFFKQLTKTGDLDLPPEMLEKAQRLSLLLWRRNPRAYCMVELVKDFTIGDGVRFKAKDDDVQAILEQHWELNEWDDKLEERMRALALLGEQLYPAFVNKETGLVRISSITPFRIKAIMTDPENAEEQTTAVTTLLLSQGGGNIGDKPISSDVDEKGGKRYNLIRPDDNGTLVSEPKQGEQGIAFYFPINRISGSTRGVPDLLSVVDWLEGLDNFLFSVLERAEISQELVWDLEYEGLNEGEIRKMVKKFVRNLRSGGVIGHNEKMKVNIKVPEMGSSDADTTSKMLLRQIQAGARMSGLFFGDSEDLTRSSASELSVPVSKMIQGRQNFVRRMFRRIFKFQIQEAKKAGKIPKKASEVFQIDLPQVYLRDLSAITRAAAALTSSLEVAVSNGWVSGKESKAIFRIVVEQIVRLPDDDQGFSEDKIDDTDKPDDVSAMTDMRNVAEAMTSVYGPTRDKGGGSSPGKQQTAPEGTSV